MQKVDDFEMYVKLTYVLGTLKTQREVKSSDREAITVPTTPLLGRPSPSRSGNVSKRPCREEEKQMPWSIEHGEYRCKWIV